MTHILKNLLIISKSIILSLSIRHFFVIILLISIINSYAQEYQFSSKSKKAVKAYNIGASHYTSKNYNGAITSLEKSLDYDRDFIEAWLLLGDIYSDLKRFDKAIDAYNSALAIDSEFFPPVYYFLANIYYDLGDYENSSVTYNKLLKLNSISEELRVLATDKLMFADTARKLVANPVLTNPQNIGSAINTSNDEYINYVNTDFDLLMLTKRTKQSGFSNAKYVEELYYSDYIDSSWSKPKVVNLGWKDERLNMGTINFSTDGRTMFFTGCYWPGSQGGCDLYFSKSAGSIWLEPTNIGNSINTSTWESQPIISSDSKKLFFASKRAGGKGGSDIWMSIKLKDNTWSPPVNLGDSINTSKDEMAPFLHADGNTLFFASKGHPGLGGYDLFVSRADALGRWSLAKNIGYPTNSLGNEINIFSSIDGKRSWISSDRAGGNGNYDIYEFDNYNEIMPDRIMYVEGLIVDKTTNKPVKAKVEITNLVTAQVINTTYSDSIGGEFLIVIYPGVEYAFNISKPGYLFLSENINLQDSIDSTSIKKLFELSPFKVGSKLVMNNIFFQFNKHELLPSSYIELNKLSELLNEYPTYNIEISGHTDSIGTPEYNILLSKKRAESVGKYLIVKGVNINRLSYKAMGSSKPIATNESEQGRAKNRRTEILIK